MPTHLPSTLHQLRVAQAELASLPAERVSQCESGGTPPLLSCLLNATVGG